MTVTAADDLAIAALEASGPLDAEAVDRFLKSRECPIVEGRFTTFVFRGQADSVRLVHWIYGLTASQAFERVNDSDLWYLVLELPEESRIEYKFEVAQDGDRRLILDPLNQRQARDPFGANSVLQTRGYEVPDWCLPDAEARPGKLEEISVASRVFGTRRHLMLYLPARLRRGRTYPLLVVHDGADYLRYSGLKTVLDNLIHRLEIPPMIAALTHPGERLEEYANDELHARYLTEELVPLLESELPVATDPGRRGLMGASFGAVATLSTACRCPGFFGRLLLQSGSFAFTDVGGHDRDPVFDPVVEFVNGFRRNPQRVAQRVYMSCGIYESLIYENRSLVPVVQSTGMELRFTEARDGHNWENWRDRLREGLSWLFPGPLWMVYE